MQAQLDKLTDEVLVGKALEQMGVAVERQAKINAPGFDGQLANSISSRVEGDKAIIGTNLEYAVYVHQGTGIYAVNGDGRKDAWAWPATDAQVEKYGVPMVINAPTIDGGGNYYNVSYDKSGQAWIWTRGQKPNPFLTNALHTVEPDFPNIVKKVLKEALK